MTQIATPPPTVNGNGSVVKREENIVDSTLRRIQDMQNAGDLKLPANYSAPNALKAAWLILQDVKDMNKNLVLTSCTKESIAYALLNMVLQGLNPMKRQCSFIAYGNKLTLQREYQGTIALAKRVGLKSVKANAVFEGDEFKYETNGETGRKKVLQHEQSIDSLGGNVKGAYAIVEYENGTIDTEIMSMKQIMQAWQQGPTKGQSPAHKNFPDQMACKTVIGRALKSLINSSDDAALFDDDEPLTDPLTAAVTHEINTDANKKVIDFDKEETPADTTADVVHTVPFKQENQTAAQAGTLFPEQKTEGPGF